MLKKLTLATAVALSLASTVAYADSVHDRQASPACERAVAPNICK